MSYKKDLEDKYIQSGELDLYPPIDKCVLKIEVTNICNHACVFCPHSKQKRKMGIMDDKLLRRLIKEGAEQNIKKLALFMNGEPFVVPNIAEYIRYAKMLGYEYVFITTNGALASPQRIIEVIDAGIDSIKFSINAGSKETYLKVHGKDNYDEAMSALKFAYNYRNQFKKKCKILVGYVVTDITRGEMESQYEAVKNYCDDLLFFKPDNFGGYMVEEYSNFYSQEVNTELPWYDFSSKRAPCTLVNNSINITYEGFLALCCSETLNYLVVEDLNKMSLKSAWYSPRMIEIRKRHYNNDLCGTQCYICLNNKIAPVTPFREDLYKKSLCDGVKV